MLESLPVGISAELGRGKNSTSSPSCDIPFVLRVQPTDDYLNLEQKKRVDILLGILERMNYGYDS